MVQRVNSTVIQDRLLGRETEPLADSIPSAGEDVSRSGYAGIVVGERGLPAQAYPREEQYQYRQLSVKWGAYIYEKKLDYSESKT